MNSSQNPQKKFRGKKYISFLKNPISFVILCVFIPSLFPLPPFQSQNLTRKPPERLIYAKRWPEVDEWEWGEEAKSIIAQPQVNKPSSRGFFCGTDAMCRGSGEDLGVLWREGLKRIRGGDL